VLYCLNATNPSELIIALRNVMILQLTFNNDSCWTNSGVRNYCFFKRKCFNLKI